MTIGVLLIVLALGMLIPSAVDLSEDNPDWQVFAASAAITGFVGTCLALTNRGARSRLSIQQAFLLTSLVWVALTFFAAIPFSFSQLHLSFTDAFFEAMSGVTTTGSTVIIGLDELAPGLLLWRAILQWLGGLGIIVVGMSFLPMLRIGGMQMFRVEAFETEGKMLATAAALSARISVVLVAFTVMLIVALWACGMTGLEAAVHAMTTIATGGYSTSDASVGHFDSPAIEAIITVGMVAGGIPFVFYVKLLHGDPRTLFRDSQVRCYLAILLVVTQAIAIWLWETNGFSAWNSLRYASFNVVSIMTGTGYASADYGLWGTFPQGVFFFLMFVGGCYGSTACGIKIFRFQILYAATVAHVRRLVQPHGVFTPRFNRNPISDEVISSVLGYFMIFGATFVTISMGLNLLGLDLVTAMSGAGTAMSNVGPGLGPIIGPAGNFQTLPDTAKWLLSAGMLIGRLEVFSIFVLLNPGFWRG
jgi:trk system potassium uptake protein TrkH